MFADADLFGIPIRVVVSPKTAERGVFEVSYRDKSFRGDVPYDGAAEQIAGMVKKELGKYE